MFVLVVVQFIEVPFMNGDDEFIIIFLILLPNELLI